MAKTDAGQKDVKPSMDGLLSQIKGKGPAPVHLWNPAFCGDIDMHIARDGTWFYMGSPIGRPAMVRLFSSILKREGNAYFLVTPVEKVGITVEDAPFVAVDFTANGDLTFTTHVGDKVTAGPDHPIRMDGEKPYIMVRGGMEALIDRKSFYRLVELGEHRDGWFGVASGTAFFRMMPSDQV